MYIENLKKRIKQDQLIKKGSLLEHTRSEFVQVRLMMRVIQRKCVGERVRVCKNIVLSSTLSE